MKKEILITLLIIAILSTLSSAATTTITVKTLPSSRVEIYVLDSSEAYYSIQSFFKDSGGSGEVSVVHTSDLNKFDIKLIIKRFNVKVYSETHEDFEAGNPVTLYALVSPENETQQTPTETNTTQINETSQQQTNITENTTETITNAEIFEGEQETTLKEEESSQPATSFAISENFKKISKKVYYVIGIVILVAVVLFVGISVARRMRVPSDIKITKMSEKMQQMKASQAEVNPELKKAEDKLRKAQDELTRVMNREKISAIERKMDDLRKDLEKLK